MENLQRLREENAELKKTVVFLMNRSLTKKLSDALKRINDGEYVSEEEFFNYSPQEDA